MYGIEFVRTTSDTEGVGGLIDEDCIWSFHNEMQAYHRGHGNTYVPESGYSYEHPECIRLKCKVENAESETSLLLPEH